VKYAVQMGSGSVIYIPYLIKTASGIQNLVEKGRNIHTDRKEIA
jgi:hypothetical protein